MLVPDHDQIEADLITDTSLDGRILVVEGGVVVLEYVFRPDDPVVESPRPYAKLYSLAGQAVTGHRPDDHPWHKGFSLALPNVGKHNFWGGPTYVRGQGYIQLDNNGSQVHRTFTRLGDQDGIAGFEELLDWKTESGETILTERRAVSARRLDSRATAAWSLSWSSLLVNTSAHPITFSSPSAEGRESAGYAGLFWRGPESFTGGAIESPDGLVGETARGRRYPWLAYQAPHDDVGVLVVDANPQVASLWFARSEQLAGLCATPFYNAGTEVPSGEAMRFAAVVTIGDRHVRVSSITASVDLAQKLRAERATPSAVEKRSC